MLKKTTGYIGKCIMIKGNMYILKAIEAKITVLDNRKNFDWINIPEVFMPGFERNIFIDRNQIALIDDHICKTVHPDQDGQLIGYVFYFFQCFVLSLPVAGEIGLCHISKLDQIIWFI